MKHKYLLLLLVILGLTLAGPAQASLVSLSQNLPLGIAVSGTAGLAIAPGYSSTYAFASASADNTVTYEGPLSADEQVSPPGTAMASIPPLVWLGPTSSTTTVNGMNVTMSASMSGNAPAPFGSLSQSTFNALYLVFVADADGGDATVTITPSSSQSLAYGVTGQSGPTLFWELNGLSWLQTAISSSHNQAIPANFQELLSDQRFDPIADFSTSGTPAVEFSFLLTGLGPREYVYLDVTLTSGYQGSSETVPLPPAACLLGSGLALLLYVRRKDDRS